MTKPEERVRQWFMELLRGNGVDDYRMATEYPVAIGNRRLRADIVVFEARSTAIKAIVECKAPTVELTADTMRQAAIYNSAIAAQYLIVTNGNATYIYDSKTESYMDQLPVDL